MMTWVPAGEIGLDGGCWQSTGMPSSLEGGALGDIQDGEEERSFPHGLWLPLFLSPPAK